MLADGVARALVRQTVPSQRVQDFDIDQMGSMKLFAAPEKPLSQPFRRRRIQEQVNDRGSINDDAQGTWRVSGAPAG